MPRAAKPPKLKVPQPQYFTGSFVVKYVSDESLSTATLREVLFEIEQGCAVGAIERVGNEQTVTRKQAQATANAYGNDGSFFEVIR